MFHEYRHEVTKLKMENAHFEKIFDEHNELDNRLQKIERGEEILGAYEIDTLKKRKLLLKDEAYAMILEYRKTNGK